MNYPRASELQLSCGPDAVNRLSGTILLVAYEEGALEKVTPFAACSLSSVCCLSRVTTFLYCVYFLVRFSAFMFDATRFHYMILFVTRMFVLHGSCSLRSIGSSNYNHLSSSIPILSVMPKKVMKHMNKRTTPWPAPKRGKARSNMKASNHKQRRSVKKVAYVRHPTSVQKKVDRRYQHLGHSVQDLANMTGRNLLRFLRKDGVLPRWEGRACPRCAHGTLSTMYYSKVRKAWVHRCSARSCDVKIQPHSFHPIFFQGNGQSLTPLGLQAAILHCALVNVPVTSVPALLNVERKTAERIYTNLEVARARHMKSLEAKTIFGKGHKWADIEADEVDLGKEGDKPSGKAKWEQWGGMVERGQPQTLVLYRLSPKLTAKRAPGPGPIRLKDWKKVADKFLRRREVILHTDGARAYKLKIPGVIHDHVVHKKKRVKINGKFTWVKPHYTKVYTHKLPCGKTVKVKSGTQIIDRFWGILRQGLKFVSRKPGSCLLERKVRSIQWIYCHKGANIWKATGEMLQFLQKS